MSKPVRDTRVILLGGTEPLRLSVTPAACMCLEEMTGESILAFVKHLREFKAAHVYKLLWAFSASDRAARGIGDEEFPAWVDLLPVPGDDDWPKAQDHVYDLITTRFFGQPWAEMKAAAQAAEAQAAAMTASPGTSGPTSPTDDSDGALTPTGTE